MLHVEPPQFEEERESSDDFFFGYLQLKWRRLFRVLCLGAIGILPIIFLELSDNWFDELEGFLSYFMFLGLVIFLIGLISWVLKPFIVNRDEEVDAKSILGKIRCNQFNFGLRFFSTLHHSKFG